MPRRQLGLARRLQAEQGRPARRARLQGEAQAVLQEDRVDTAVRRGAFHAARRARRPVAQRLRSDRHDAKGPFRLLEAPLRGQVRGTFAFNLAASGRCALIPASIRTRRSPAGRYLRRACGAFGARAPADPRPAVKFVGRSASAATANLSFQSGSWRRRAGSRGAGHPWRSDVSSGAPTNRGAFSLCAGSS